MEIIVGFYVGVWCICKCPINTPHSKAADSYSLLHDLYCVIYPIVCW